MAYYQITGKNRLNGQVEVETSKNATLPILAASVLSSSPVTINKVPNFSDISNMLKILQQIGAKITTNGDTVTIDNSTIYTTTLPLSLTNKIRASIFLLGPLLSKHGSATSNMPGGCNIGERPIDIHLKGFKELGISVTEEDDKVICNSTDFTGGEITLRFASVGATENLIMCAVLKYLRVTVINNAAKEPEIVDLCNFINKMGGKIYGAGTSKIVIVGVSELRGTTYTPIPDRIIAGTYLIAAAMCGGSVLVKNAIWEHNQSLITNLLSFGCALTRNGDNIYITSNGLKGGVTQIETRPYPGYPTDLQAQTMAMLAVSDGTYTITENLFETRFKQAAELVKMGAAIVTNGSEATIYGKPNCYKGNVTVTSSDLRGGASLVLAALASSGTTIVENIHYIERGYDSLHLKLSNLGANIKRIE